MRAEKLAELSDATKAQLAYHWPFWARPNQILPPGHWTYWLILAGRGFGKTRTGSETVRQWVRTCDMVNLIGATVDDARDIMIEGESGILAICPRDERPEYRKSERKLIWPNGATSLIFTADEPERLRGKQHKKLWADEMASWRYAEAWDQAKFGLRLGDEPQALITTTPRPVKNITDLIKDSATFLTRGTTYDNKANLAPSFFDEIVKRYEGTRLGRQELNAEVLTDTPGALWNHDIIGHVLPSQRPTMQRIVIGVDPAVTSEAGSNETGIIAAGLGSDDHGYVLADRTGVMAPVEWAKAVKSLYDEFEADRVVVETNQGGEMVKAVLRAHAPNLPVFEVRATRGKYVRAEPISALYAQGRVHHAGLFEALEDQMCAFTPDFDRANNGSPDRVDALVWALTDLFPSMIDMGKREDKRPAARSYGGDGI